AEQRRAELDGAARGSGLAHALARMLEQRVRDLVAHDHRHLVVVELQLLQDAVVEGDLAARHAEGVELLRADEVDLPAPVLCALVALSSERNDALRNGAQPHYLRMVLRADGVLPRGL